MKLFDLISMTFRNLLRRKARTLLTMTGVVVGTCAIVVMISLGLAMTQAMEESLAQMGDLTQITIQNYGSSQDLSSTMRSFPRSKSWKGWWQSPHGKRLQPEYDGVCRTKRPLSDVSVQRHGCLPRGYCPTFAIRCRREKC